MSQKDSIQHFLSPSGIRITAADASHAAREAEEHHGLSPLAGVILGKVLTATAMMATDFKNHEGVSLKWDTRSPLGTIHTDAYEGHFVRGYIENPGNPLAPYSAEDEGRLINNGGKLFVTRYSLLKLPYVSAVDLTGHDVASCIDGYLNGSDQTLSHVEVEAELDKNGRLSRCAGFLAQLMPEGDKDLFHQLFDKKKWDVFNDAHDVKDEKTLEWLLDKEKFVLIGEGDLSFRCTCSMQRIENSLQGLPQSEKESLLKDDHIEIVCHYCGKKYNISRETLKHWFELEKEENA